MLIKSQLEVRLHTGRSVHFHPSRFTRPSIRFFEGLVPRLMARLHSAYGILAKLCFKHDDVIEIHDKVVSSWDCDIVYYGMAQM